MRWLSNHDRDAETVIFMAAVLVAAGLFLKGMLTQGDASFLWMEAAFLMLAAPFVISLSPKKILTAVCYAIVSVAALSLMNAIPAASPFVILASILLGAIALWVSNTID